MHLFDRTRSLSLHLFEHVHGESRDRGQAMVDLKSTYEDHGFEIDAREMPDYIPLFLEFLSLLPEDEARDLLEPDGAHLRRAEGAAGAKGLAPMPRRSRPCSTSGCSRIRRVLNELRKIADRRSGRSRRARPHLGRGSGDFRRQRRRECLRPGPAAHADAGSRAPSRRCRSPIQCMRINDHDRLSQHLLLRDLSLYRARRPGARLDPALRPRALYLAVGLEPAAAPSPARPRLDPLPCRRAGHLRRAPCRPADADPGLRSARHQP